MYPFKAILVGEETAIVPARRALAAHAVEVEATFPDATATCSWLSQAPAARRLFVVHVAAPEQLEGVKQLRGCCVGQPILALSPAAESNSESLIQLMRAGVDQAVLLPVHALEIKAALDSLAWQFGLPVSRACVIAVAGATPGCGVSTVAVNLAYEIAHGGRECILVEATQRMGKLAGRLGVTPRFSTHDLAAAADRLDLHMVQQALIPLGDRLGLLAAKPDEVRHIEPGEEQIRAFFMMLRHLAEVAILRANYNVGHAYLGYLAAADELVVVGQHTASSLQDLKLMCQMMRREYGVRTLYPVINRYDQRNRDPSLADIQQVLEEPRVLTVAADRGLGSAPDRVAVLRQNTSGRQAVRDIQAIARVLLNEPEPTDLGHHRRLGWLRRLFVGS